jgi:hypothetical protein
LTSALPPGPVPAVIGAITAYSEEARDVRPFQVTNGQTGGGAGPPKSNSSCTGAQPRIEDSLASVSAGLTKAQG